MLVWLAAPGNVAIDRAVNLALIVLAVATVYRVTTLARSGLLWRVSRKLILSYILVGAVPILLIVTFSLLAFLLVFFDISSYLVQNRVAHLIEQASVFGRTTMFEIERAAPSEHADIIQRRQLAIASRYPDVSIALVPEHQLPKWVSRAGFTGLVDRGTIARAVLFPRRGAARDAVVVDLPVDSTMDEAALAEAGITLGERRRRLLFNTATYLTYVDWDTGASERTPIAMSVDIPTLYNWMGGNRNGEGNLNFNRILFSMLVGIGVLLLVIEVVALSNGLALARTITTSVDELFSGTERVKSGNFEQRVTVRSDDQLGQLSASFNDMTGRIQHLLLEQDEKRRLEQELQVARDIQMSLLPQGALEAPGMSVAALCVPAREVGGDYYDFLPLAGRAHRPADRRRVGKRHVGGTLHGRAEGVDALAQPHSHVPARTVDRGKRDHREPSRQPQLHHDDLCGDRSRGGDADVRARRAYTVHANRRAVSGASKCWRPTEWSSA